MNNLILLKTLALWSSKLTCPCTPATSVFLFWLSISPFLWSPRLEATQSPLTPSSHASHVQTNFKVLVDFPL